MIFSLPARSFRQSPRWRRPAAPGALDLEVPRPLKAEHDELHAELEKLTQAGGGTGQAAAAVAALLRAHFPKEEEFALPPLGLLPLLAASKATPEMADVLPLTEKLKAELPQMLSEHGEYLTLKFPKPPSPPASPPPRR